MQEPGTVKASFRPNETELLAIEAKLNFMFGAQVYDTIFLGFEVLEVFKDELRAWSRSVRVQPASSTDQCSITRNETRHRRATCLGRARACHTLAQRSIGSCSVSRSATEK
jgi:hypothetical protein